MRQHTRIAAGVAAAVALALTGLALPQAGAADNRVTLTLLHNNDGESKLLPQTLRSGATSYLYGGAAAFKAVAVREKQQARSLANNSVIMVYAGDSFLASRTLICSEPSDPKSTATVWDAAAQKEIGYDAHILGNHEFDYGTPFLRRYINAFAEKGAPVAQPFLSGNLDYRNDPNLRDLVPTPRTLDSTAITPGKILGQSMIYTDPKSGQRFGIVSAITPTLQTISSPLPTTVTTPDLGQVANLVQKQVNGLQKKGINKIILVSHLQNTANDKALLAQLTGVDVAVAGGGDELLASPDVALDRQVLPGATAPVGNYPELVTDKSGTGVPLVTAPGDYAYLGRIDLEFTPQGRLIGWNKETSFPRRVVVQDGRSGLLGIADAVLPNVDIYTDVQQALETGCLAAQNRPFANSAVVFNTSRGTATAPGVRTAETNGGNLVADAFLSAYNSKRGEAGLPAASATNPVVAVTNGGGIRINTLPATGSAGDITRGMTFDLLPFDNRITVVADLTSAQLKEIFERSCSTGPASAGGQFLQVSGLKVTCSSGATAQVVTNPSGERTAGTVTVPGSRVRTITLDDGTPIVTNGVPVASAPVVDLVTNSFTAAGGDNYPTLESAARKTNLGISYEQALYDYLLGFPKAASGLPTVPATDARYTPGVNTRFFWVS